jgi:hypothetical protein
MTSLRHPVAGGLRLGFLNALCDQEKTPVP